MKMMVGVTLGISVFIFMALYILQAQVMWGWIEYRVLRIAVELGNDITLPRSMK